MAMNEVPQLFRKAAKTVTDTVTLPAIDDTTTGLTLFRGSDDKGRYVSSPFVTKVEFRLRLSGVDYDLGAGAPWLGPKGKIPYLALNGQVDNGTGKPKTLGDSTLIIQHLMQDGKLSDLNDNLAPREKAEDLALRSLLEDKLYFYHV